MATDPTFVTTRVPNVVPTTIEWDWDSSELDELEWWRPGVLWRDGLSPARNRGRRAPFDEDQRRQMEDHRDGEPFFDSAF